MSDNPLAHPAPDSGDTIPISKSRPQSGEIGSCPRNHGSSPLLPLGTAALLVLVAVVVLHKTAHKPAKDADPGPVLQIASQPPGATILLNGRLVGATPVRLEHMLPGSYCVRLEKSGCQPLTRNVDLNAAGALLEERLEAWPTGALTVSVKPVGAEVLLDGELIGNTPLKANELPAGNYELLIRKTNFDSHSAMVTVAPGDPLVFSDFELKDKVLAMLELQVKTEPQRAAHYIDLGHYLFVNDRLDDAATIFAQGMAVAGAPLDFSGPGYPGEDHMTEEEKILEKRLRLEDITRFQREKEKHYNWPRKDTKAFRDKLAQAETMLRQKNVGSWAWTKEMALWNLRGLGRSPEKAVQLYKEHLEAVGPEAPSVIPATTALIEAYLMQREVANAQELFEKFLKICQNDSDALLKCGSMICPYHDRMSLKQRVQVLEMAERALRQGLDLTKDRAARAQGQFDLASVMMYAGRSKEAVPLLEQCIAATTDASTKEQKSLRLAEALRLAGRIPEAQALYTKLEKSASADIRDKAKTGLIYVANDRSRSSMSQDKPRVSAPKGK